MYYMHAGRVYPASITCAFALELFLSNVSPTCTSMLVHLHRIGISSMNVVMACCVYVCMCICMNVRYACMHACMVVCMHVCMDNQCTCVRMNVYTHAHRYTRERVYTHRYTRIHT